MKKVLIIYSCAEFPTRETYLEYLYSFRKYSEHKIYYWNLFFRVYPLFLKKVKFDLVIFYLITPRSKIDSFKEMKILKDIDFSTAVKAAFFQDEFCYLDSFCEFINKLNIQYLFSVAPTEELIKKIYDKVNFNEVGAFNVLTGYLDEFTIKRVNKLGKKIKKDIDIGYRTAYRTPYHLGEHGVLKSKIATLFSEIVKKEKINADISNDRKKMLAGNKWYNFLLRCKYTIGVESGSSLIDRDGSIYEKIQNYLAKNPNASFEEVREKCFMGLDGDGNLSLKTLSPRHLEACLTRTCQVLVEGEYNGILKPWKHYIPLKRDFNNIDEIVKIIKEDKLREKIVENAYNDIVLSGEYSYRKFVDNFFKIVMPESGNGKVSFHDKFIYYLIKESDRINWFVVAFYNGFGGVIWRFLKNRIFKLSLKPT